jgi:glycosyltransferase involved in cell wall biosynthesis
MKNRVLIAANFPMENKLIEIFEREMGLPADVLFKDSSGKKSSNAIYRHYTYFIVALKVFINRNNYHSIIFWQQFIGLYYGLISRFFFFLPVNSKSLLLTLIFVKRQGFAGRIYFYFFRFMLNSRALNYAICHSETEKTYYQQLFGSDSNKIVFARVGEGESDIYSEDYTDEMFFFSGGGSQRDYKTLIEAFRNTVYKLKIACMPGHVKNIVIPPNVEVVHNVWHREFDALMKKSYAVIIPLKDPKVSSGQLVLIKAMRMSKPAIVTAGDCLKDYTHPSYSISVKDHSSEEITNAVSFLYENKSERNKMAKHAFNTYQQEYSRNKYIRRVCMILLGQ